MDAPGSGVRFNRSDAGATSASAASPVLWNLPQLQTQHGPAARTNRSRLHRSIAIARRSFRRKRARARMAQLGKQAPCRHVAARVESFGKSLIDGRQHIVRLPATMLSLP